MTLHEKMQSLDRMIERDAEEDKLQNEYVWALVMQHQEQREKIKQKIAQKENVRSNYIEIGTLSQYIPEHFY